MPAPSPEQKAFLSAFRETNDNLAMNAVAGSGKTTVIEMANYQLVGDGQAPFSILNLAFAKRNQLDFQARMPARTINKTAHALGLAAWIGVHGKCEIEFNRKIWDVEKAIGLKFGQFPGFKKGLDMLRTNGVVPPDCPVVGKALRHDYNEVLEALLDHIDLGDTLPEDAMKFLTEGLTQSIRWALGKDRPKPYLDGTDMLYMPIIFGGDFKQYANVFADEAQDFNILQHALLRKVMGPASRIVIVGDPHQAIYGFRGAEAESFYDLVKEWECVEMPLSVCFRCSKNVINYAQSFVPHIKATEDAPEGQVKKLEQWTAGDLAEGDVILCRYNKPLVMLYYKLIKARLPAKILGADVGKGLIAQWKKFPDRLGKLELAEHIGNWAKTNVDKYHKKGLTHQAAVVQERAAIFRIILSECRNEKCHAEGLGALKAMFSDEVSPITLSTGHKAKGLEWHRVWFMDRAAIPSIFATTETEIQQEHNLVYVMATRARRDMFLVSSKTFRG